MERKQERERPFTPLAEARDPLAALVEKRIVLHGVQVTWNCLALNCVNGGYCASKTNHGHGLHISLPGEMVCFELIDQVLRIEHMRLVGCTRYFIRCEQFHLVGIRCVTAKFCWRACHRCTRCAVIPDTLEIA